MLVRITGVKATELFVYTPNKALRILLSDILKLEPTPHENQIDEDSIALEASKGCYPAQAT